MSYNQRVKLRIAAFRAMGYSLSTATRKAYALEAMLQRMAKGTVRLYVGGDPETGREPEVISVTLVGNKRLQNQSPKWDRIVVINADTRKKIVVPLEYLVEDDEVRKKKEKSSWRVESNQQEVNWGLLKNNYRRDSRR